MNSGPGKRSGMWWKLILVSFVLGASLGVLKVTYSRHKEGLPKEERAAVAATPAMEAQASVIPGPAGADFEERLAYFTERLDLTKEQQDEIRVIHAKVMSDPTRAPWEVLIEAEKLLTPEQMDEAQAIRTEVQERLRKMIARDEGQAKEALNPGDFAVWARKREEARKRFLQRNPDSVEDYRAVVGEPPPMTPASSQETVP